MIFSEQIPAMNPGVRLSRDPVSLEPLLLYPEGFLFLNATAHEVVIRCDGKASVEQIIVALMEEYEADPALVREEILGCLHELKELRLIHYLQPPSET